MDLIVRADADARIGAGHLMRCLALAQRWHEVGGRTIFLTHECPPALADRLRADGSEIVGLCAEPGSHDDARETIALASQIGAAWVVLDGYQFGLEFQQIVKGAAQKLLVVDDHGHAGHYVADLVLDQNAGASEAAYRRRRPETRLLLGTEYVLLRREFHDWSGWRREFGGDACRLVVTLGGGDAENITLKVVQCLARLDRRDLEVVVVVGPANPHAPALAAAVGAHRLSSVVRIERNVADMPALLAWADVAVAAGGSTSWEMAFMGLPALVLVLAENQQAIAEGLDQAGAAVNLGWHVQMSIERLGGALAQLLRDPALRRRLSVAGRRLVDGHGSARVVDAMAGVRAGR